MLRYLWALSLLIRFVAVGIGITRKASIPWIMWAGFYTILGCGLRYFDWLQWGGVDGPYVWLWVAQCIGNAALLANLVRYTVHPTTRLAALSAGASALVGSALGTTNRWPNSPVEDVLFTAGLALFACGLISIYGVVVRITAERAVLAIYLIGSAILCLGGVEYANRPSLGIATTSLDCAAFAAWAIIFAWTSYRQPQSA